MPYCFVCDETWVDPPLMMCGICLTRSEDDSDLIDSEVEDDEPATDVDFG